VADDASEEDNEDEASLDEGDGSLGGDYGCQSQSSTEVPHAGSMATRQQPCRNIRVALLHALQRSYSLSI